MSSPLNPLAWQAHGVGQAEGMEVKARSHHRGLAVSFGMLPSMCEKILKKNDLISCAKAIVIGRGDGFLL